MGSLLGGGTWRVMALGVLIAGLSIGYAVERYERRIAEMDRQAIATAYESLQATFAAQEEAQKKLAKIYESVVQDEEGIKDEAHRVQAEGKKLARTSAKEWADMRLPLELIQLFNRDARPADLRPGKDSPASGATSADGRSSKP